MHRQVTKKINKCFAEKAAITLLTEGEPKRKYQRKRIAQSFCSPDKQPQRKNKKTVIKNHFTELADRQFNQMECGGE